MAVCLGDFVEKAKPISATAPLSRIIDMFQTDASAQYFILVRDKRPAGLISRTHAFELAVGAGQGNLDRLAIGDLITARALILKADTTVQRFLAKAGDKLAAVITRGCIIVEDRRFKGVLSPSKLQEALIASLAEMPQSRGSAPIIPAASLEDPPSSPLLGSLAHEIRTPLTAIMGLSEILATRIRDEENRDIAQTIVRSGQAIDRILTDTLDFASLEAGKLTIRNESADLTELISDLRRLWATEASRRGLAFRVGFIPDGPHWIDADLGRIRQIANNLISNAVKFTREGEVNVSLTTQPMGQSLMLTLSVTDTGRGLNAEQRERYMQVFEKGPESGGAKGWGLGLTISRALASALGGQLRHSDNPGGGSIFTLTIPVSRTMSEPVNWMDQPVPRKGKFELGDILLVEDHEASAMVVINALEQGG
ncbi:MAG: ATP-binding protein, partial [Pseudomonadota bacterium]